MSIYQDQVFDFQDVRKSLKPVGRAYQRRSVAMIELCRLFLELSRGSWDQVFELKRFDQFDCTIVLSLCADNLAPLSLVNIIDKAVEHAVKAGKDKNADADKAFVDAEEKLNRYARLYHQGYEFVLVRFTTLYYQSVPKLPRAVLGDMQNIIRLATKEDNDVMKSRLGNLLPRQSSVGGSLTNIRCKSGLSNMFEASGHHARELLANQDTFSDPNIAH